MPLASYLEAHRDRHLQELLEFLAIPSVSADPRHRPDVRRAAEFLHACLGRLGLESAVHETPGHPVVTAQRHVGPDAPTVLIYGHYDVQPPEPLELWESPPFEPRIASGKIYARGASDDKGQVFAHLKGVEAVLATEEDLPLNIRFLIEGEEEVSSLNLDAFVAAHEDELRADTVVISDGAMIGPGLPTLTYGLRGIAYIEVRVRTADRDLHSGAYGGGVPNPLNALAAMIASLHDEQGRVAVPGFYERVRPLSAEDRRLLSEVPFDAEGFLGGVGVKASPGEQGYTLLERLWARPSLDVNGIGGGFQGEGSKTVIPAQAMAKISCRLVPDQDPSEIRDLLAEHLTSVAPAGVSVEVIDLHGGRPALTPVDSPGMRAAREALEEVFGRQPVLARSGGSIPVVSTFRRLLGADVVLLDMGLESDRVHAPNEHFAVENFYQGIHASAALLRRLAKR